MREQLSKRRTTRERRGKTVMTIGTTNTTSSKAWKLIATHDTATKSTERAPTSKRTTRKKDRIAQRRPSGTWKPNISKLHRRSSGLHTFFNHWQGLGNPSRGGPFKHGQTGCGKRFGSPRWNTGGFQIQN